MYSHETLLLSPALPRRRGVAKAASPRQREVIRVSTDPTSKPNKKLHKSRKKGFFRTVFKFLLLLVIVAVLVLAPTNIYVVVKANQRIVSQSSVQPADCIIVLGALVQPDGQPSLMLKDRLDVAYELYSAGAAPKLLVSGDHGTKSYDEVNNMRKYLEGKGVPTDAIFMDHAGFDTYDTMYRARDVFGVKSAIVVTQKYHLYRAVYLAQSMGVNVQGVACDRYRSRMQLYYDARELAARAKDFFGAEIFKPAPKYLGDAIPISGSGVATHDK
jgi:vancomycin permeability regulator SanA